MHLILCGLISGQFWFVNEAIYIICQFVQILTIFGQPIRYPVEAQSRFIPLEKETYLENLLSRWISLNPDYIPDIIVVAPMIGERLILE